jgi:Tol biopolymer transport system component
MTEFGEISEEGSRARQFSRQNDFVYSNPKWSPDGAMLIYTKIPSLGGIPEIAGSDVEDIGIKEFVIPNTSQKGPMREGDFSPDAKWITYEGWPDGANHDIWIMTRSGGSRIQITQHEAIDFDPAWGP